MAIVSELRILLRVINAGQSELAKMTTGVAAFDAANKRSTANQLQLSRLQAQAAKDWEKAAAVRERTNARYIALENQLAAQEASAAERAVKARARVGQAYTNTAGAVQKVLDTEAKGIASVNAVRERGVAQEAALVAKSMGLQQQLAAAEVSTADVRKKALAEAMANSASIRKAELDKAAVSKKTARDVVDAETAVKNSKLANQIAQANLAMKIQSTDLSSEKSALSLMRAQLTANRMSQQLTKDEEHLHDVRANVSKADIAAIKRLSDARTKAQTEGVQQVARINGALENEHAIQKKIADTDAAITSTRIQNISNVAQATTKAASNNQAAQAVLTGTYQKEQAIIADATNAENAYQQLVVANKSKISEASQKAADVIAKANNIATTSMAKFEQAAASIAGKVSNVFQRIANVIGPAIGTIVNNVGRLSTFGVAGLTGLVSIATVVGIEFDTMKQKAEVSFGALLGGLNDGKKFVSDLFGFTRTTALGFGELTNAAQEFLARGFNKDEILSIDSATGKFGGTLKAVGDQAAALSKPIGESIKVISFNLGQIHSSAILQQRDVRDLANAGVKAWQYLAKAAFDAGKITTNSVSELRTAITKHKVELTGAFAFAAITAGMEKDFSGMLQVQARTFAGMVGIARRTFSELAGIFAQPLFDKLSGGIANVSKAMQNADLRAQIAGWGQEFAGFITAFTQGFVHGVIPALQWIANNRTVLVGTIVSMGLAFAWVHPVIGALALLGGTIAVLGTMNARSSDLGDHMLKIQENVLRARIGIEATGKSLENIKDKILNFRFNYEDNYTVRDLLGDLGKIVDKVWNIDVKINVAGHGIDLGKIGKYILGAAALPISPAILGGLLTRGVLGAGQQDVTKIPLNQMTETQAKLFGAQNTENIRAEQKRIALGQQQPNLSPEDLLDQEKWAQINLDYKTAQQGAEDAAQAAKEAGENIDNAFSAIDNIISKVFSQPTKEQAGAQLAFDEASRSFNLLQQSANDQTYALDVSSRAIDRNRLALEKQSEKLDDQSYALTVKAYGIQQQISDIQRRNRPPPKDATEAQIQKLEDQLADIDKKQHGLGGSDNSIDQQRRKLELLNRTYDDQQKKINEDKKLIQDGIDAKKHELERLGTIVSDYDALHKILQDKTTLGKVLISEKELTSFVNEGLIPFVKEASQKVVDMGGGYLQSILTNPLDKLGAALDDLANDKAPNFGTALANIITSLTANIPTITPRAKGGPVSKAKAYLVGEKGAELFTPKTNGYIIPNHQLRNPITQYNFDPDIMPYVVTAIKDQMTELYKTYTGMKPFIPKVTGNKDLGDAERAAEQWDLVGGQSRIDFSKKYLTSPMMRTDDKLDQMINARGINYVTTHEFGHALEHAAKYVTGRDGDIDVDPVSPYAKKNNLEAFAEAFTYLSDPKSKFFNVDPKKVNLSNVTKLINASGFASANHRRWGGSTLANQQYMVGEHGVEAYMPDQRTVSRIHEAMNYTMIGGKAYKTHSSKAYEMPATIHNNHHSSTTNNNNNKRVVNLAPIHVHNYYPGQSNNDDIFRRIV